MELKEIVDHCRKGNQVAFSSLFDKYYQIFYHVSRRILVNHHDVEDVLIIAFTRIFANINKVEYTGDPAFVKWMKTIVVNESIRFIHSKKPLEFKETVQESDTENDVLFQENKIDIDTVYKVLSRLPDGYRIVFNLFAVEGYSHREISHMLDISESTSKSQLRKARSKIIDQLKDLGYEKK